MSKGPLSDRVGICGGMTGKYALSADFIEQAIGSGYLVEGRTVILSTGRTRPLPAVDQTIFRESKK